MFNMAAELHSLAQQRMKIYLCFGQNRFCSLLECVTYLRVQYSIATRQQDL